jgi:hypothetical protein
MATLTVGADQQYTTIAAAVAASATGDTINVQAGTYTNDFASITHDLTLNAVGGTVKMVATTQPPNGKAMIDEGGAGVSVTINGFDISGVSVPDGNGAAVRYEGGNLTMTNDTVHDNQEGILSAADPAGNIVIDASNFANNGAGDGFTHNIYVGAIASLTVENSTITGAAGGHDIKSRALATTVTNNVITDGTGGTASYEIDLPNGGVATVAGNVIEKGVNATNPNAISFGEEGNVYAGSSLAVQDNSMLNDNTAHSTTAVVNDTGATATISGNSLYGWSALSSGLASASGNITLAAEPSLSGLTAALATTGGTTTGSTTTGGTTGDTTTGTMVATGTTPSMTFIGDPSSAGNQQNGSGASPSMTGSVFSPSVIAAAAQSFPMDGAAPTSAWQGTTPDYGALASGTQPQMSGTATLADALAQQSGQYTLFHS